MKLLHTIHSANPAGGGVIEAVAQLARAQRSLGDEIDVISLDAPNAPWLKSADYSLEALGERQGGYGATSRLIPWLTLRRHNYDAIIVNGLWQYHGYAVHQALRGSDTPYFVFPHGMLDPWFKRAYPWKHSKKQLYWWLRERHILNGASAVFFTTEEERRLARGTFFPYQVNEAVVNLGTAAPPSDGQRETDAFYARFPELRGRRVLLFLARLHGKKGCDLLLRAFAQICGVASGGSRDSEPFHLVMAGPCEDSAYLEHLKALGASLRGDCGGEVTWPGMLQGDIKWGALRAAEALVLPSHQENFGFSVVEALACGTPVLISDKVNIWREILQDQAGLVASDDLDGTVDLLDRWTKKTRAQRATMKQRAAACFHTRFDAVAAATNLRAAIAAAGERRSRPRAESGGPEAPFIRENFRLKINLILPHQMPFPPIRGGGVENLNWSLSREFARQGHEVVAYSRADPRLPSREVDEFGIRHVRIRGYDLHPNRLLGHLNALRYARNLESVLEAADVSSFHTPFSFLLRRLPQLGVTTHTLHRTPKWPLPVYRKLDRIYCGSDAVVAQARQIDPQLGNLKRIYNCVGLPAAPGPPQPRRSAEEGLFFLYVGRFVPDKGIASLVKGMRRSLRDWPQNRLETIGPQHSREGASSWFLRRMRAYIRKHGLESRIVFRPAEFDRQRLDAIIREADVICVPSLTGETFSMAILEAMALAKPVLVSDFSPMPEAVDHKRTGYVAYADDAQSLAAGIAFFSKLSREELHAIGQAGFEKAKNSFSVEQIANEYLEDFNLLASLRRRESFHTAAYSPSAR
jgi:glycosyltransferase involved in cell wall biosynthesis